MTGGFLGLLPGGRALASPAAPQISDQARANAAGERVIIYSLGIQRVSVFGDDAKLIKTYLVSGHKGMPRLGRHRVYSKSPTTFSSNNPALQWKYMVRFARSSRGNPIGFHQIPVRCINGKCTPVQGSGQVGSALSAGCVRQRPKEAQWLYQWAGLGTLVIVTP